MPTALITGITGQDGTFLSADLTERGYEVHGIVKPGDGADSTIGTIVHDCDIRDSAGLRRLILDLRPDELYNLAGQSSVVASWADPLATIDTTATPVGVVLDAAWELHTHGLRPRVLQASSAEIFGQPGESPQSESTRIAPVSPYGAAKALGHFLVGAYRTRGLHATSVILYNHESTLRPNTFVTRKITRAAARISRGLQDTLSLGTLDVRRDWGWAPDYVRAMQLAIGHDEPSDYVIGTGIAHTIGEFAEAAFGAVGITDWQRYVVLDPALERPADPVLQVADSAKARDILGWAPTVGFEELVRRMVEADLALIG